MRSVKTTKNLLCVGADNQETGINVFQTLDTTFQVGEGDIINLEPRKETDVDEANGLEEANVIYSRGATSALSMNFDKAQPQHIAFLLAYGLGLCSSQVQGNGYAHTITPIQDALDYSREHPGFSAAQRLGYTIAKRRFASMFVDSFNLSFVEDQFVKISGSVKGTGKAEKSIESE